MNLKVDPERVVSRASKGTGIFVRAQYPDGGWGPADLNELDKASVLEWLRSGGGANRLAEDTIGVLLGHGHLHRSPGDGLPEPPPPEPPPPVRIACTMPLGTPAQVGRAIHEAVSGQRTVLAARLEEATRERDQLRRFLEEMGRERDALRRRVAEFEAERDERARRPRTMGELMDRVFSGRPRLSKESDRLARDHAEALARSIEGLIAIAKPAEREDLIAHTLRSALRALYERIEELVIQRSELFGQARGRESGPDAGDAKSLVFISNSPSETPGSAGSVQDDGTGIAANNSTTLVEGPGGLDGVKHR